MPKDIIRGENETEVERLQRHVRQLSDDNMRLGKPYDELNARLDEHQGLIQNLQERVIGLERRTPVGGTLIDIERGHARALAERDEALELMKAIEDFSSLAAWRRARDAFLERIKRPRAPT